MAAAIQPAARAQYAPGPPLTGSIELTDGAEKWAHVNDDQEFCSIRLVHLTLVAGRLRASLGGPRSGPNAPRPGKLAEREAKARLVSAVADEVRPGWERRMQGVDQHCLRKTHRTWALMAGVPGILIDRQLGHASPAGEAAQSAAWSLIGRKHYTDVSFLALDAKKSADAVRGVLDRGEAELTEVAAEGGTALVATERVVRKAARR